MRTVYTLEDACDLWEISAVQAHNEKLAYEYYAAKAIKEAKCQM